MNCGCEMVSVDYVLVPAPFHIRVLEIRSNDSYHCTSI